MRRPSTETEEVSVVTPWSTAVGLVLASTLALVPALAPVRGADQVAVVYPPWWSAARAVAAAARTDRVVSLGAAPFVVVVRTSSADALARLKAGGALAFLNPVVGACGQKRTS